MPYNLPDFKSWLNQDPTQSEKFNELTASPVGQALLTKIESEFPKFVAGEIAPPLGRHMWLEIKEIVDLWKKEVDQRERERERENSGTKRQRAIK